MLTSPPAGIEGVAAPRALVPFGPFQDAPLTCADRWVVFEALTY